MQRSQLKTAQTSSITNVHHDYSGICLRVNNNQKSKSLPVPEIKNDEMENLNPNKTCEQAVISVSMQI